MNDLALKLNLFSAMRNRACRLSLMGQAVALTVASMLFFSVMSICIGGLSGEIPSAQMVFMRNAVSLGMMSLLISCMGRPGMMRTERSRAHMLRSLSGFVAMELWFYSLTAMPLTLATALSFTTPVFGTLCSMWLLKEPAGWRRWCAIAVSFAGVLVILRPGAEGLNPVVGIVLLASCLMALSGTAVKSLSRTEAPETIVFYMGLFMTLLSVAPGMMVWVMPTPGQAALMVAVAICSTLAQLTMAYAYRRAEMGVLLPLDFLRLVFTAAMAYAFFGERIDTYAVLGAMVILASSVYIIHRETLRRRQQAS